MVMETPSPQCVGLEFVRQYYTVMNKAPLHLHRFYSNNSSFMHGCRNAMSEPIIGQADIHNKILSLDLRDCHAKIRMVDAHATLGNGVVIQVTGELSNNGMPMRRFMQTFVLAPQSTKKYYVHNDIFRYQDEVFSDDEGPDEGNTEGEDESEPLAPPLDTTYGQTEATVNGTAHHPEPEPTPPVVPQHTPPPPPPPSLQISNATQVGGPAGASVPSSSAGTVQVDLIQNPPTPIPAEPSPPTPPPVEVETSWNEPTSEGWGVAETGAETWEDASAPVEKTAPDPEPPQLDTSGQTSAPAEPKTYANLFKTTGSYMSVNNQSVSSQPPPVQNQIQPSANTSPSQQIPQPSPPQQQNRLDGGMRPTGPPGPSAPYVPRFNKPGVGPPRPREPRPYRYSDDTGDADNIGEERRRNMLPDSQQIFVGNLPLTTGEEDLRSEFSRFGKIVDIRINTAKGKTGSKGPGHTVPNFGFITFQDESSVNECLNSRPILLNGEHRLNVEEKKARNRNDSNLVRPGSGRGGMGSGIRQGPMGGLQGRGGGRGGMGGGFGARGSRGGGGFIRR